MASSVFSQSTYSCYPPSLPLPLGPFLHPRPLAHYMFPPLFLISTSRPGVTMAPPRSPAAEMLARLREKLRTSAHTPGADLFATLGDDSSWMPETQLFASSTPGAVLDRCLFTYRFEPRLWKLVQSLPPSQKNALLHCLRQSLFHTDCVRRNELVDCFGCHQRPQRQGARWCTVACQIRFTTQHVFAAKMLTKTIIWLDNLPDSGINLRTDPVTLRAFPLHHVHGEISKMTHTQCSVLLSLYEPLVYSCFNNENFDAGLSPGDQVLLSGLTIRIGKTDSAGFELTLGLPTEESRKRPIPDGLDLWHPTVRRMARLASNAFWQMNPWREAVPGYREALLEMKKQFPFKVDDINIMLGYLASVDSDGVTLRLWRNYKYAVVVSLLTRDVDHALEAFADRHERWLDTFTKENELIRRRVEMWQLRLRDFAQAGGVGVYILGYSKEEMARCRPKWRKLRE
ncbi:uncharacterized protein F5Z01DRAFT_61640 [Emericellopsis atlantica]|uniref:Uncharacterized protein n=1 Tax=Emericellopsis atlantica TaxID=2614577 RepID=A0A9P8CQB6_9HYPO|nr:uncharacterized protein F5Z01DRAFT_61640 [Emericellopsis atlantica]KAG9254940.1 hypothetical protein F5Z01DRAFT_61640 [Emericellopsis atlantica]